MKFVVKEVNNVNDGIDVTLHCTGLSATMNTSLVLLFKELSAILADNKIDLAEAIELFIFAKPLFKK